MEKDRAARVQKWLDSVNLHEQSFSGLHIESNREDVEPAPNPDESMDSDYILKHYSSYCNEHDQSAISHYQSRLAHNSSYEESSPLDNDVEVAFRSKINSFICNGDSGLESTIQDSESGFSGNDSDYDADVSTSEAEFDLINKSIIVREKFLDHGRKKGLDLLKIASLFHEPVIRKLYYLEVYGIFYDSDSSEIEFDLESEYSDDQGFKPSQVFWHSTPRADKKLFK